MVERTVRVRLMLDDRDYKAEKSIAETGLLDEKLKDLNTDAGRAGRGLSELGATETKVAMESGLLAAQIERTKEKLNNLNRELNQTGDVKFLKDIRAARSELRQLERAAGDLTPKLRPGPKPDQPDSDPVQQTRVLGIAFNQLRSALIPILLGVLVAISPLIGGAVQGALLTAVGGGGIALGVIGQIHDPRVHAALVAFGRDFKDTLTFDTRSFAGPLVASLAILQGAATKFMDTIDFSGLADTLVPLADGIAGLVDKMGPGLKEAGAASLPIIKELAKLLPSIGTALSEMFHQIAQSPQGAIEGLRTLVMLLGGALIALGGLIRGLSTIYSWMVMVSDKASGFADRIVNMGGPVLAWAQSLTESIHGVMHAIRFGDDSVTQLGRSLKGTGAQAVLTSDDIATLTGEIGKMVDTQDTAAGKMTDFLVNSMLDADRVANNFQQTLTSLSETLKQNGNAIDKHTGFVARNTKEGEANRDAILSVVEANLRVYDSNISAGMSAEDAATKYDESTRALRDQLTAAHFTGAQIDELIGKYGDVPHRVNTMIAVEGLTEAINKLDETLRLINNLPPRKDININTFHNDFYTPSVSVPNYGSGGSNPNKPRAEGGNIEANQIYLVGEHGRPELFVSRVGGMMYPDAQRYTGYRASGSKGATRIEVRLSGDGPALNTLLAMIRKEVRVQGSNSALGV